VREIAINGPRQDKSPAQFIPWPIAFCTPLSKTASPNALKF